ncbi:MAG: hypothetical protein ACOX83_11300 [Candidatus Spyradocola sp.]|jgi:hypothetical protein
MARPAKAIDVLTDGGSSHLTKEEIKARKDAESAFASGATLRERPEVRTDAAAHREFLRVSKILSKVGKNDALFEPVINRYCQLQSECAAFEAMREGFRADLDELREDGGMEADARYRLKIKMQQAILDADKQVQAKRKMMFDIEKECAMTISSAVRTVPKAPAKQDNPLLELLNGT